MEIFSLVFFMSSTMLYSMVLENIKVFDEEEEGEGYLEVLGVGSVEWLDFFF